jgi:hypothetical protein
MKEVGYFDTFRQHLHLVCWVIVSSRLETIILLSVTNV